MAYRSPAKREDEPVAPLPDPTTIVWVIRYGVAWMLFIITLAIGGFVWAWYGLTIGDKGQAATGLGVGITFLVFFLAIRFRHRIDLDPLSGEVRVRSSAFVASPAPRTHHARDIACAKKKSIDESNFELLVLLGKDDEKKLDEVIGTPKTCAAAAKAINEFLRELADDREALGTTLKDALQTTGASPAGRRSPFAGWRRELPDDVQRELVERFLMAIDPSGKVVPVDNNLELHGTRDGFAYRVVVHGSLPSGTEVILSIKTTLHLVLEREDDKDSIYSGKPDFERLPHDLQIRLRTLMADHRLCRIAVRNDELELRAADPPNERRNPVAQANAMLAIAVDAAKFASTITEEEEEEEEGDDDDEGDQGSA